MKSISLADFFLEELRAEVPVTRKCLERISPDTFKYKPHEKSMEMGYLTILVADIPRWITHILEKSEVNFATFERWEFTSTEVLLKKFDEHVKGAEASIQKMQDEDFDGIFELKNKDQVLQTQSKKEAVSSTLNHWVHHRGQLTVYMRLNDIPVPSIYGPSADEKTF